MASWQQSKECPPTRCANQEKRRIRRVPPHLSRSPTILRRQNNFNSPYTVALSLLAPSPAKQGRAGEGFAFDLDLDLAFDVDPNNSNSTKHPSSILPCFAREEAQAQSRHDRSLSAFREVARMLRRQNNFNSPYAVALSLLAPSPATQGRAGEGLAFDLDLAFDVDPNNSNSAKHPSSILPCFAREEAQAQSRHGWSLSAFEKSRGCFAVKTASIRLAHWRCRFSPLPCDAGEGWGGVRF